MHLYSNFYCILFINQYCFVLLKLVKCRISDVYEPTAYIFSIKFVTISEVMHMNECADGTEAVSLICRL